MNPNCPDILKKLVPLSKVVNASIIDFYEDIGKTQQLHFHWAARGLKKLQRETLKSGRRNCLITVNQNTRTASLPPDFDIETFVGYINDYGEKIAIPLNTKLTNDNSITTIECEDTCAVCGQDSTICNDLTVTETTEIVTVNTIDAEGVPSTTTAEKTVIKKLYPDGGYYLETTIPYWNLTSGALDYATTKEYIATIDLSVCGCINPTAENIETIRNCCYDAYCCHYAPCSDVCDTNVGSYKIFEETGQIQFDYNFRKTQVYLEYRGFIPKLNGQLAVPEVAFETLVEYIKAMAIDGKKNVSNPDKAYRWTRYGIERRAMIKVMSRVSLDDIIHIIGLTPKFNWLEPAWNNYCPVATDTVTITNASVTGCDSTAAVCNVTPKITPFQIAVKVPAASTAGLPVPGDTAYQNDDLIGAFDLEYIIVNNAIETKKLSQFTFNSTTGNIERSPNTWFEGDVLIVNFNKMV